MKEDGGFWWPASDKFSAANVLKECEDAQAPLKYCRGFECCIQAGGNVGVWASILAFRFREVWTFEVDLENYLCLLKNVPDNVYPFWAALGHKATQVGLLREKPQNCAEHRLDMAGGNVAMVPIDAMELDACDLIILDTEGTEHLIIDGARETIRKFKPVLMIEDCDNSRRYGKRQGWPELDIPGYRFAERVRHDVILVPR